MKILKLLSTLSIGRIAIVAVLVSAAYYYLYYDDGSSIETQIAGITSQIETEKAKKIEIEKKMKKEEEMRGNLVQLAKNLDSVKSKIPNEFKETEMSAIVNRVSAMSGVRIIVLSRDTTVQPIEATAANADATVKKPLQGTGAELIEEVRFKIDMSGSFNAITQFVELLSKEEKIIKVRNFIIEKSSTNPEDSTVKFSGEIIGFKQATVSIKKQGDK